MLADQRMGLAILESKTDHSASKPTNALPLPSSISSDILVQELFIQLFQAAIETAGSVHAVRFLSRYKSANNIKQSAIWAAIGQAPWSHPYGTWYHKNVELPFQALRAASELGEYTVTDRGTWWAVEGEVRERMVVFVSGLFLVF